MLCFVTNEILPGRRGGIGFYLEEALRMLEQEGLEACLLVSTTQVDPGRVEAHLRSVGIRAHVFGIGQYVEQAAREGLSEAAFRSPAYAASYYVSLALEDICRRLPIRIVEFTDYGGPGFLPIRRKRLEGAFHDQVLAVRVHGTAEVVRSCEGRRHSLLTPLVEYFAEGYAVRHADVLMASTPSVLEEYGRLYGRGGRGVVSPLPVRKLSERLLPLRAPKRPPCSVLFVGTCQKQKGPETFVEAAVRLLERGLKDVRFVLMGRDFPTSIRYGSYEEELKRLVPARLRGSFDFRCSYYGADQLLDAAKECAFAVLPSRWEAFSLVAHELRWLGVPLVLSPIPPFEDCFVDGQDAAFFDGTVDGLASVMGRLLRGETTLSGRQDVESLYVTAASFAGVYSREIEGARALPPAVECGAAPGVLLSVIVAAEGSPEAAERTVRSVVASSHQNVEVLVTERGTWGTAPEDVADGRVRRLHRPWAERGAAWNLSIEQARGEFVCCLPAGYEVSADYFARALRALERCPDAAYVSCFAAVRGEGGPAFVDTPYGLDPVLVSVEDRTGLRHTVMRRSVLAGSGLRYREDLFAMEDWELGWAMAERGLQGEVLPEVLVSCTPAVRKGVTPQKWVEQYHLLQQMAEAHPDLVMQHPSEMLKAHIRADAVPAERRLADEWLLANYRGLRLIRVGLKRCIQEGPRAVFSHFWQKVRQQAAVLRAALAGDRRPEGSRHGRSQ